MEGLDRFAGGGVVLAGLERDDGGAEGRAEDFGADPLGDSMGQAQAFHRAGGHDQGIDAALGVVHGLKAHVDRPAQGPDGDVRAVDAQSRSAAEGRGGDGGADREGGQGGAWSAGDEAVADVVAPQEAGHGQAGGVEGGSVLEAVHGHVDLARHERRLDLVGEDAVRLQRGTVLGPVAPGPGEGAQDGGDGRGEGSQDRCRLHEGHLRGASAHAERVHELLL
nr:hypothetical protein [Streptomyces sp. COG21]